MTQQDAGKRLVEGLIRLIDINNAEEKYYGASATKGSLSWDARANIILSDLNQSNKTKRENALHKYIELVDATQDKYKENKYCGYVTKEYVYFIGKLLKIRLEAGKTVALEKIKYPLQYKGDKGAYNVVGTDTYKYIARSLSIYGNTNVAHHLQEVYGQQRIVDDVLSHFKKKVTIEDTVDHFEPADLIEKDVYLNHKVWKASPILPYIILRVAK